MKSGSYDNGDIIEVKDKVCFDGIDTGKYANFLTLFNTLKKRNASSVADHTRHLVSAQQERYQLGFVIMTESNKGISGRTKEAVS